MKRNGKISELGKGMCKKRPVQSSCWLLQELPIPQPLVLANPNDCGKAHWLLVTKKELGLPNPCCWHRVPAMGHTCTPSPKGQKRGHRPQEASFSRGPPAHPPFTLLNGPYTGLFPDWLPWEQLPVNWNLTVTLRSPVAAWQMLILPTSTCSVCEALYNFL